MIVLALATLSGPVLWYDDHLRTLNMHPDLALKLTSIALTPAGGGGKDVCAFVVGNIINHGSPGAVDDFKMDLVFDEPAKTFSGQFPVVPNEDQTIALHMTDGQVLGLRGNTYWTRTARLRPIPNTAPLDGWIMAVFDGATKEQAVASKAIIVLRGTDTAGKKFSAQWRVGEEHANEKPFTIDQIQK